MSDKIVGKNAAVDVGSVESTVGQWEIDYQGDVPWYAASNTSGGIANVGSNYDWTGFYVMWGYTPTVFPNDTFTFKGSIDGTNGATGAAMCLGIEINWNLQGLEDGRYIYSRVWFGANGALTLGAAAASDSSTPAPVPPKGRYISLGGAQQAHVAAMKLRLYTHAPRVWEAEGNGWPSRVSGDIDGVGEYTVWESDPTLLPTMHNVYATKWYVTATKYWQVDWMRVDRIPKWGANRKPNTVVSGDVRLRFCAHNGTSAGSIVDPETTPQWP